MKRLILIRGLPGSGKSYFANQLLNEGLVNVNLEADMFFQDYKGEYVFDSTKLSLAHEWCRFKTKINLLNNDKISIAVANTFTTLAEIIPYIELANEYNAELYIVKSNKHFGIIHNISKEVIEKMKNRWEDIDNEISMNSILTLLRSK